MFQAVQQDLGIELSYTFGQIWLNQSGLQNHEFKFDKLELHADLPYEKTALNQLKAVIEPEFLTENFIVRTVKSNKPPVFLNR